jgi:predicted ester cyclase
MAGKSNLEVMRTIIEEAFNRENMDALYEWVAPDFIEHQFGLHPTIEGMAGDIHFLHTAFPDFRLSIEDYTIQEDKVWMRMTARGTNTGGFMGPPNGKTFAIAVFDTCRFKDGKMVEHWGSPDRFALLHQLELIPKPQGQSVEQ